MKTSQAVLNKVEKILDEAEYVVRYERGTFQSGYCILESKKVVVLNKFLDVEGRINTLTDLLPKVQINFDLLTHDSQKLYTELIKKANILAAKAKEEAAAQQAQELNFADTINEETITEQSGDETKESK